MKEEYAKLLEEKCNYYKKMAAICEETLSGKSMKSACDEHGISLSSFRNRVFNQDECRSLAIPQYSLEDIAINMASPEEKILREMLDIRGNKIDSKHFIDFPDDFEETVDDVLKESCEDRTYKIMKMRYFDEMSYDEIGAVFGISRSRVQQIIIRTIRNLRRNDRFLRMLYGNKRYAQYREEVERSKYIETLMKNLRAAKSRSEIFDSLEEKLDDIEDEFQNDFSLSVESLGLDTRTFNGLQRKGVTMITQVLSMTDEELLQIRNFGTGCLNNLNDCLASRGFSRGV